MQTKTLFFILFNLCFLSMSYSQQTKCTETRSFENATYIGCLDYEGNLNGFGTMTYSSGNVYAGNWIRNTKDGFGTMTFSDGDVYVGSWKNNRYEGQGNLKQVFGIQVQQSKGLFENGVLFNGVKEVDFGDGNSSVSVIENQEVIERKLMTAEYVQISFGAHSPTGQLNNGTNIRTYQNNRVSENEVSNGVETETKNNTKNYYNKEDISGGEASVAIDLEKEGNTMYVNLEFSTQTPIEPVRFIFDTGAEVFSIGYRLFEYLKKSGLQYDDLDIIIPTFGVSGVPSNNKLIKIHEITIGAYSVKNVVAYVETLETANMSLLGIQFMKKFSEVQWSLNSDELVFYK